MERTAQERSLYSLEVGSGLLGGDSRVLDTDRGTQKEAWAPDMPHEVDRMGFSKVPSLRQGPLPGSKAA